MSYVMSSKLLKKKKQKKKKKKTGKTQVPVPENRQIKAIKISNLAFGNKKNTKEWNSEIRFYLVSSYTFV